MPLKDAMTKGGYTAPTCVWCHAEFEGEFTHNLVRKVRWGFNPTPAIADNLGHPWFEERKESWVRTCSYCHSARFARDWLDTADKGTIQGLEVEQEAKKIVQALYDDGLMVGQKDNRPAPPAPETDAPGGFFALFWASGNNPSLVDRIHADMWEHDLIKHYKGLFHVNPGGFTYTEGWSELLKRYTEDPEREYPHPGDGCPQEGGGNAEEPALKRVTAGPGPSAVSTPHFRNGRNQRCQKTHMSFVDVTF